MGFGERYRHTRPALQTKRNETRLNAKLSFALMGSLLLSTTSSSQDQPGLGYWQLRREATERFQKHDYRAALEKLLEADRRVPGNPDTIFRLAAVNCFLGEQEAGMQQLRRLLRMRTYFDLTQEPAFAGLEKNVEFRRLVASMEELRTMKTFRAKAAFRIADPTFLPEGIAYDPKSGSVFLSSLRHRKIVRFDSQGKIKDFVSPRQNDIWSISGIGTDSVRRVLWACSNRFDGAEGYTAGMDKQAALYAYDLDTANFKVRYSLQQLGDDHFCDGLTVGLDGTVFVADSSGLIVYQLKPGEQALHVLVGPEAGISPQGLALSSNGSKLYFSNYLSGIYAVDLVSGRVSLVRDKPLNSLAGIDGLVAYGQDLIAIQNGIQPNRVVMLKMSPDGMTVERVTTLEINHPLFGEPTLGAVVNHSLLFVANNPIERFLNNHTFTGFKDPVVLRRTLKR
jgi:sugar lactone lactonase YvrE